MQPLRTRRPRRITSPGASRCDATALESAQFEPGWQQKKGLTYSDLMWVATGERLTAESFERYRKQGGIVIQFQNTEEMVHKAVLHPLGIA